MKYTANYNLKKPEGTDVVNIDVLNDNADIIDSELKKLNTNKVDKVAGKGLSTNDFTTTEKNKLAGIEEGAQKNKVNSVNGKTGAVTITKSDVGLGNVTNNAQATKEEFDEHLADLMLHTETATGTLTVSTDSQNKQIKLGFRPKYVKMLIETHTDIYIVEFIDGSIYGFVHTNSSTGTTHEHFLKKDLGAGITDDGFYCSVDSGTQLEYIAIG